jgi:raffinose/stachyose/melibiose transport system permease protein
MLKQKKINAIKSIVAAVIILFHIAPLYILCTMSLKSLSDVGSRWSLPKQLYFQNFQTAMDVGNLLQALKNTLIIVVFSVAIIVVVSAMAAYPLSRLTSKTNKWILGFIVGVMMVPQLSILVPLYKELVAMKGINHFWGVILVSATFNLPMAIYMYTNFISAIPKELDEAAMIDGCSRMAVFYRIILPSLKPVTASVIIWTSVGIWNDYQFQLYFLQKPKMQTITLAITKFFTDSRTDMGAAAAAALIVVLPPVIMYILLQKQFVQGAMDSAVK